MEHLGGVAAQLGQLDGARPREGDALDALLDGGWRARVGQEGALAVRVRRGVQTLRVEVVVEQRTRPGAKRRDRFVFFLGSTRATRGG